MKLSYEWLNEWIDLSAISPKELGEKMSRTGIEVESVEIPGEELKKLVVGLTTDVQDHPDSDHLHVVTVEVGQEEPLQIVCGAPNIAVGQKVIVALHKSRIAGGHQIKKGKLRGVESQGMICSLQEIGIPSSLTPKQYEEGIYVFEDDAVEVGASAIEVLGLDSAIIELDLTANRSDALSVRGAIHEIAAIYGLEHHLNPDVFERGDSNQIEGWMSVEVQDSEDAPAYHIQIIKDVTIQPSPVWMQRRLIASGIRPINNVVDVTNYVLLEYGQPLHAFDYDQMGSKEILVRRAIAGEKLETLDGIERCLQDEIVITNGKKPLALAGVMGGKESEITNQTKTVALEAALFNPQAIRQSSARHNLRSESSARFEKGVNKATILQAGKRAAALIAELGNGTVIETVASVQSMEVQDVKVPIRLERINHVLGTQLTEEVVSQIFAQLGFKVNLVEGVFEVLIPARRWDISIEADLIEEVGRIYGYDKLPMSLPKTMSTKGGLTDKQRFVRWIRQFMQGVGLSQAYSYALTTPEKSHWFTLENRTSIRLSMPMSEERSELRQSMLPSLLEALQYNVARSQQQVRLFEVGRIFAENTPDDYMEKEVIGAALTGEWRVSTWQEKSQKLDFFTVKGILGTLFDQLGCSQEVRYEALKTMPELHPGQAALIYLKDEVIGFVGQVHPSIQKQLDLSGTFVFELQLEPLLAVGQIEKVIQAISKFPGMSRDIALQVPVSLTNDELVSLIQANGGDYLKKVTLFDVYEGEHMAAGYRSLAYNLQFLNTEATLQEEEVSQAMEQIRSSLLALPEVTIR